MAGFYEMNHKSKKVFCLDITDLQMKDTDEVLIHVEQAMKKISRQPPKSVLHITNVTNTGFNSDVTNIIKEYAKHNTPYIKASAIVGLTGLQKIIYTGIKAITGRDFHLASTMDEALEWLEHQ
jgi:hypothetical protein